MSLFDKAPKNDPSATPDGASGEQRIVTLLKYLFQEFAGSENLDTEQMRTAKMKNFVAHATTDATWYFNADVRRGLRDTLRLRDEDFEAVWTCFQDPWTAVSLLYPFWHVLVLAGQPPLKHIPEFFHISLTFAWYPGSSEEKALQIQVPTKWKPGSPLTNGFLCALLKDQFDGVLQTVAGNGLDALFDKYAVPLNQPGKSKPLAQEDRKRDGFGLG
jgi:hypothetical protein